MTLIPVGEAAAQCGVSPNALRYYERVGLLDPVRRDAAGRRAYDDDALAAVRFVTSLRATGMPIRLLREYMDLARQGRHTVERRRQILQEHRHRLHHQRADIDDCLETIGRKIDGYARLTAQTPPVRAA